MEMDYNLKTLANIFKFFLCIVETSHKIAYSLILSSRRSNSNFMFMRKEFFVKNLSSFDQNTAKWP